MKRTNLLQELKYVFDQANNIHVTWTVLKLMVDTIYKMLQLLLHDSINWNIFTT